VKESYPYVYVYCYRLNITIRGQTRKCPVDAFRLNATLQWNTTDYRYVPINSIFDKTVEILPMTHEVHDTHFINNEHLVDDNEALDKILSLSKELDKVHKESLAIELPIPGGGLSYSSALKTTDIHDHIHGCYLHHDDLQKRQRHKASQESTRDRNRWHIRSRNVLDKSPRKEKTRQLLNRHDETFSQHDDTDSNGYITSTSKCDDEPQSGTTTP